MRSLTTWRFKLNKRKYPDLHVGDKVKVYKEKGVLAKEVVGDYKYHATVITRIEKSLGQIFYKVQGEGKPFLRSDILLINEAEEGGAAAAAADPPSADEPYMSYHRKRIRAREARKADKAVKAVAKAEANDAVKRVKANAKAAVEAAKAGLKAERARLRAG